MAFNINIITPSCLTSFPKWRAVFFLSSLYQGLSPWRSTHHRVFCRVSSTNPRWNWNYSSFYSLVPLLIPSIPPASLPEHLMSDGSPILIFFPNSLQPVAIGRTPLILQVRGWNILIEMMLGHGARKHHFQGMTVIILDLLALEDHACLRLL